MKFLKECLTVLLIAAFSMAVSAKVNVTYDDYTLAEVTGNNINIRSGAGTEYPKLIITSPMEMTTRKSRRYHQPRKVSDIG